MMIGNSSAFAIEYQLDGDFGGAWLYGKICYWIGGERIGDFELGTSLRDVLIQINSILKDCGKRKLDVSGEFDSVEIFHAIDNSLYGPGGGQENQTELFVSPARFDIRVPVDVFDQWKIYLFEVSGSEFFLYKFNDAAEIKFCELRKGVFDAVLANFYEDLNAIYEKES